MSFNPQRAYIRPWSDNKKLTVVNLYGGPGVGKSVTAAELFPKMKRANMKVELVHEIAKDYVWERWDHIFQEQDYITAHQHRLQRRLVGHDIDYVVVDSALLLGLIYAPKDYPSSFAPFLKDVYNSYTNVNIFLKRSDTFEYDNNGRNQSLEQAIQIDAEVLAMLNKEQIPTYTVASGDTDKIMEIITTWFPPKNNS